MLAACDWSDRCQAGQQLLGYRLYCVVRYQRAKSTGHGNNSIHAEPRNRLRAREATGHVARKSKLTFLRGILDDMFSGNR